MPTVLSRAALLVMLAVSLGACASGGASRADGATEPVIIGQGYPDLGSLPPDRTNSRVDVRVMVNPDGTPDLSTLRVTGISSVAMRDAFTTWIARSRFKPATQNGQPVRGEYQLKMKSTVRVTRVS